MHDESDKYLVGIAALGIGAFPRGAPRLDPTNFQALCAAAAQSALIGARRVAVGTEIGGGNAKSPPRLLGRGRMKSMSGGARRKQP